jgi:hypothetical protein
MQSGLLYFRATLPTSTPGIFFSFFSKKKRGKERKEERKEGRIK